VTSIRDQSFDLDSPGQSMSWKEQVFLMLCAQCIVDQGILVSGIVSDFIEERQTHTHRPWPQSLNRTWTGLRSMMYGSKVEPDKESDCDDKHVSGCLLIKPSRGKGRAGGLAPTH
jgi:hypothetical protein